MKLSFKFYILIFAMLFANISVSAEFVLKKNEKRIKSSSNVKKVLTKFGNKRLENILREFTTKGFPNRVVGTKGHFQAQEYIIESIQESFNSSDEKLIIDDFTPDFMHAKNMYISDFNINVKDKISPNNPSYRLHKNYLDSVLRVIDGSAQLKGKNIIWEKKGTNPSANVILLGAHYDTIGISDNKQVRIIGEIPGADNNATGVASLLSLIKVLQNLKLEQTVRVVFFDFESLGFLGSREYVRKYVTNSMGREHLYFLNLIMLGYDTKVSDKLNKNGNMSIYGRNNNNLETSLYKKINRIGKKSSSRVKFSYYGNNFNSSSTVSFWEYNFPTLVVTGDWDNDSNPNIFTKNDFVETLNLKTLFNSFKYISGFVISEAMSLKK